MAILNKEEAKKYMQLKKRSNTIIDLINSKEYDCIDVDTDKATLSKELNFLEKVENRIMLEVFNEELDTKQWNLLLQRISKLQRYIDTFTPKRRF